MIGGFFRFGDGRVELRARLWNFLRKGVFSRTFSLIAILFFQACLLAHVWAAPASELLLAPSPLPGRVAVHVIIPQGTRGTPLAFHYLEHLVWLNAIGPEHVGPDRDSNAITSAIAVDYWLSGEQKDLVDILRRLARIFRPLALPRKTALAEREILLREYETRVVGHPLVQADLAMSAFLYAGNRIAHSPVGTPQSIQALNPKQARELHAATHRPQRARVLIIGNLTRAQALRAMKEAGWPLVTEKDEDVTPPAFHLAAPETKIFHITDPQVQPRLIWRRVVRLPAPVDFDILEAQGALLAAILDSTLPGGLAGPLRYDAALAASFIIAVRPIDARHVEVLFEAIPETGVSLPRLRHVFEQAWARVARAGIPEATFRRVLKRFTFWPDWDDEQETLRWLADYAFDRVFSLRRPLARDAIRHAQKKLSRQDLNALLRYLAGAGRTAIAFIQPATVPSRPSKPGEHTQ